ncbi:MAG TPA: hypothetical protein VK906_12800 [Egicoccus sp.]|nr:hypothetical protein [Egicoccus sp.]HSK24055.1 hypothetical protein [Egicoccus sp.]
MLLRRRGLTGQRYDLVGPDGELCEVRLRPVREGAVVTAGDGSGWRIERDPGFGAWRTRPVEGGGEPLVSVVKGFSRERYELDFDRAHLVLVRRRGFHRRRMDLLDGRGAVVGEVVRATVWSGAYDLRLPALPDAVLATIAFLVVLLNRRDNAATWS